MDSIFTRDIPGGSLVMMHKDARIGVQECYGGVGIVVKSYRFKKEEPLDYFVADVVWSTGQISYGILATALIILTGGEA
jgi:hypothetical protein